MIKLQSCTDLLYNKKYNLSSNRSHLGEVRARRDDPVKSVFLHIHGDSDDVIQIIRTICENANWRAYDITISSFMNFEKYPAEGFHKWKSTKIKFSNHLRIRKINLSG